MRPSLSGMFLIAAGVFLVLPQWLGDTFLFVAAVCLVLAGALSKR